MAAPMPLDAPVTTATFPSSFADMTDLLIGSFRRCRIFVSTGKYIRVDSDRRWVYCIDRYEKTEKCRAAERAASQLRLRSGPGPGAAAVLGERLRGNVPLRPDRGDGHQPPQPVRRLRQQGSAVSK